jgi:hypothetical protein
MKYLKKRVMRMSEWKPPTADDILQDINDFATAVYEGHTYNDPGKIRVFHLISDEILDESLEDEGED